MPGPDHALKAIAEALVTSSGGYLRSTVREPGVTCEVCSTPVTDHFSLCLPCNDQVRSGLPLAVRVASMVYAIKPRHQLDQMYKAMLGYKAPAPVQAHRDLVRSLLALGLKGHAECDRRLSGQGTYQWAAVPSTRHPEREQPLRSLLVALARTPSAEVPVRAIPGAADYRQLEPGNYAVDSGRLTAGGHVLLIDDSWVRGAHAQSAAAALRQAGAGSVSILTVARVLKPDFGPNQLFIRERLIQADYDPQRCPWTGGECPWGTATARA